MSKNKQETTNIMEFIKRVRSKMDNNTNPTYKDWMAKKFATATELEEFLNEIKPQIIGKPLEKISIVGHLFDPYDYIGISEHNGKYYMAVRWCGVDENGEDILEYCDDDILDVSEIHFPDGTWDEYSAELDEPVIIQIGSDIQLEIDMQEHSLAQIGINTLKEGVYSSYHHGNTNWRDISGFYSKNLIGHNIKDIYINKTKQASVSWQVKRENGDDMYDSIVLVFDNNYKLVIEIDCAPDYMLVSEIAPKHERGK